MRIAFMGTPEFAASSLGELIASGADIAAVYTRAPKPSGRGRKLSPSPVHALAEANGLEVRTPKSFKRQEIVDDFAALGLDVAIVVAYGLILPQAALDAPRAGCFNLHGSLLPRWRGAAPIQRAIMAGDKTAGVQVMRMEAGLDTGPIALSETLEIRDDDTAGSLHDRMATAGAALLPRFLAALSRDAVSLTPQASEGVTYAEKIAPPAARLDWARSAAEIDWRIRGLSPFPGAHIAIATGDGPMRVKALMSRRVDGEQGGEAGEILSADGRLVVGCGEGAVELLRVQRAGRAAQDAAAFLRGVDLAVGARLLNGV
ncbi:MAG: methionyl-tRNA formyltransferase [Parvularculaceae bacterium]